MRLLFILLVSISFFSCKENKRNTETPDFLKSEEKVVMEYYNPDFSLDPNTGLRTDGYYEVKEFRTFDFEEKEDYYERPNYGFVQFSIDGFCRVGAWNGIHKYSAEVKKLFETGKGWIFNGLYQIKSDTLKIEYLYNAVSPGNGQANSRHTLTGLIANDKIIFIDTQISSYIYPNKHADTLTSRCVGTFIKAKYDEKTWTNYLKESIDDYLIDEK